MPPHHTAPNTSPDVLTLDAESIPTALKARAQWVGWTWKGTRDGGWTKVPINVKTGNHASHSDARTWGTFDEVLSFTGDNGLPGIGYVFAKDDPYCGVDLDKCRETQTGEIAAWAVDMISELDTYSELSPTGSGVHVIAEASLPVSSGRRKGQIELYHAQRFFTMTGNRLPGTPAAINQRQALIDALWKRTFGQPKAEPGTPPPPAMSRLSDREVLDLAAQARNGAKFRALYDRGDTSFHDGDDSAADLALLSMLAFWTQDVAQIERIFSGSALARRDKWRRKDYRNMTIKKALEGRTETWTPRGTSPTVMQHGVNGHHDTSEAAGITLEDFASYLPERKYIYLATGKMWDPEGINRAFPPIAKTKQSTLIDAARPIHDMTWAPGHPQIIEDAFLDQDGWITRPGARVYNHYRPPRLVSGDPEQAGMWLDLLERVYPDNCSDIVSWFAHRVQRPAEKLNHALVLGGTQGIGKDSLLEPVRHAVGPSNFGDVSPVVLTERFNAFLKNVILRVSELRDLGDRDRYGFYEHTKTVITAPPDTTLIDEKYSRAYRVPNLVGIIFTTNHRTDGLYLSEHDRRHYVVWSDVQPGDFLDGYWRRFYQWIDSGGRDHVAAYLASVDITGFDPKAPPPKTPAFWDIVSASRVREDDELADVLDTLNHPDAITVSDVVETARDENFKWWLKDRKNSRLIPYRFEACGYASVQNPTSTDRRWKVDGRNVVIYARRELSIRARIDAARNRAGRSW